MPLQTSIHLLHMEVCRWITDWLTGEQRCHLIYVLPFVVCALCWVVGLNDISMEEVRLNAYEAKATGNLSAYVSVLHYFSRMLAILFWILLLYELYHRGWAAIKDYIKIFLQQELISSLLILFFLLGRPLQKKPKAPSFHIGLGWNLADVLHINMHRLMESDFVLMT